MKTILDRFDLLKTWLLITLGVGVFVAGFGFGAVVADKTTDKPLVLAAVSKPAEVRAKDPKAAVVNARPAELPLGIQRLNLDGHMYYWTYDQPLIHAEGCTNHTTCALTTVLQLEK